MEGSNTVLNTKELIEKGVLYLRLVQFEASIPILKQAYQLSIKNGDINSALNSVAYLIRVYAEKNDFESILKLKDEIQDFAFLEKVSLNSQFYYTLGICSSYQKKFSEARHYFQLASEKGATDTLSRKLQSEVALALIDIEEKKLDQAKVRLEMTQSVLQQNDNPILVMAIHLNLGRIYRLVGNYAKALTSFSAALELNKYHKDLFNYSYLLYEKAMTYFELGKVEISKIYIDLLKNFLTEKDLVQLQKLIQELELKISKSFEFDIIVDRRRCKIIEKNKGEINFGGQDLILDLFILFTKNQGRIYSKEELTSIIWNEKYESLLHDNKIYVTIKRLRTLIEPTLESPQYILRSRNGYYLNQSAKIELLI